MRLTLWLGGIALVLMVIAFVTTGQRQNNKLMLNQQQIVERAVGIARNEYNATITAVKVQRMTFGQRGPVHCSLYQRVVQWGTTQVGINDWNSCDPNTPYWQINLDGTFHWPNDQADNLQLELSTEGKFMSASGHLQPR